MVFGCFRADQKGTLERKGLKAILKWRNHPSASAIFSVHGNEATFPFIPIVPKDVQNKNFLS